MLHRTPPQLIDDSLYDVISKALKVDRIPSSSSSSFDKETKTKAGRYGTLDSSIESPTDGHARDAGPSQRCSGCARCRAWRGAERHANEPVMGPGPLRPLAILFLRPRRLDNGIGMPTNHFASFVKWSSSLLLLLLLLLLFDFSIPASHVDHAPPGGHRPMMDL